MGKIARRISNLDVEKLISELNAALSEEWLAYYQYWIGARVVQGPMRMDIESELLKHADEELKHASMVAERIKQLGGTPILSPKEWLTTAKCAYEAPQDPYIERVLEQNLRGERCAIQRYQSIAMMTNGYDFATYDMAIEILNDELEHEDDIEGWMTDIELLRSEILRPHKERKTVEA